MDDNNLQQRIEKLEQKLHQMEKMFIEQSDRILFSKSIQVISGFINFNGTTLFSGFGSPEGVVTAARGSLFLRKDGGTSSSLYVKTSGTGNTGWTAK